MLGTVKNARVSQSPGTVRLVARGPARGPAVVTKQEYRWVRRRGYILIVVLGLVAVVTTLGLSFLNSHSTVMPEAANRLRATRARYLAESGVDIATHFLMYPPTTVPAGDYWPGANGIAIDATTDYTDVTVVQDGADPNLFTITANGVAYDFDGTTVAGKHTVTALAQRPFDGKWRIPYAYLARGLIILPTTAQIFGDFHANSALVGNGWCNGNVTSTATATWTGSGPPASVSSLQPVFTAPPATASLYPTYKIRGNAYTAYNYNSNDLNASQAAALNATNMSATNPGRIIIAKSGDFRLKEGAQLWGTLVVTGDLKYRDTTTITAVADYPALVVTGNIVADADSGNLTIDGSVICGGNISDGGKTNVYLKIAGACTAGTFNLSSTGGTYIFQWDAARSVFWDLAKSGDAFPVTLLDWKEN